MIPYPVVQAIRSKARIAAKKSAIKELEKQKKKYRGNELMMAVVQESIDRIHNRVKPLPGPEES